MPTVADAMWCHGMVGRALKSGRLTKQPCEVCGSDDVQAHHDDYRMPLEVRWLCRSHHRMWHNENPSDVDWSEGTSVLTVFRITPTMREAIEQRAVREQTTMSDVVRRALASYLEDNSCSGRPNVTKQGCSSGD